MNVSLKNVYYCEFCKKHGLSRHKMEYHEKICFNNPVNNRPCFYCKNLANITTTQLLEKILVDVFYCKAKNLCLYPPKSEIKNNHYKLENYDNVPMPKICDKVDRYDDFKNLPDDLFAVMEGSK